MVRNHYKVGLSLLISLKRTATLGEVVRLTDSPNMVGFIAIGSLPTNGKRSEIALDEKTSTFAYVFKLTSASLSQIL